MGLAIPTALLIEPRLLWGSVLTDATRARAPVTAFTAMLGMVFNVLAAAGIALAYIAAVLGVMCCPEHLRARHGNRSCRAHAPDA